MSVCKICLNNYDHSIRKPHHLSCQHTFCIECINKIKVDLNKCPKCNQPIRVIYENVELLELIPESNYDKLKQEALKKLSTKESEVNEHLNALKSIKGSIYSQSNLLINLINEKKAKSISEIELIEKSLKETLSKAKSEIVLNQLNEQEIQNFSNQIIGLDQKYEFELNTDVNLTNDFSFGQIKITNNVKFFDFFLIQ
jgi:hypothetical protein